MARLSRSNTQPSRELSYSTPLPQPFCEPVRLFSCREPDKLPKDPRRTTLSMRPSVRHPHPSFLLSFGLSRVGGRPDGHWQEGGDGLGVECVDSGGRVAVPSVRRGPAGAG